MDKKIQNMRLAGKILGEVIEETLSKVTPGINEEQLDSTADSLIMEKGGEAGFKKVEGYMHATCMSTNEVVVHGIPTKRVLKDGDIIGIDCGVFYEGFHTDMAETVAVGKISEEIKKFLETGKKALNAGIKEAKGGSNIGHISQAIQRIIEGEGYSVVRSLVGHGVGRELHESPEVPGYLVGKIESTPKLTPGMTIAVEVIYNQGKKDVVYSGTDDWTISTKDGTLAGLFERTILITDREPEILTTLRNELVN